MQRGPGEQVYYVSKDKAGIDRLFCASQEGKLVINHKILLLLDAKIKPKLLFLISDNFV